MDIKSGIMGFFDRRDPNIDKQLAHEHAVNERSRHERDRLLGKPPTPNRPMPRTVIDGIPPR